MSYFEAHSGTATTGKPANIQTETTSTGAAGPRSPRSPTVEAAERVSEEAKKKTIHALYNGKDKVRNVAWVGLGLGRDWLGKGIRVVLRLTFLFFHSIPSHPPPPSPFFRSTNMRTTFIETINAHPALRVAIFFSLFMLALPPLIAISASLLTLSTFGFFASLVVIAAGLPVVAVSGIGGMVGTGAMAWLVAVFGSMGGTIGWVWYRGIPLVKAYMRMGVEVGLRGCGCSGEARSL